MSDVQNDGFGRDHDWKRGDTVYRRTYFRCSACGESFWHDYPNVPDIGKAMYLSGVSEHCSRADSAASPTGGEG